MGTDIFLLIAARAFRHSAIALLSSGLELLRLALFALVLATYSPRFAISTESSKPEPLVESLPLHGAAATNGAGTTEEDDDDDDDEVDERKKPRTYDFLAVVKRIRRFLPFMAPLKDRGVQLLVVLCVLLVLCNNLGNLLLPIVQGKVINDLVAGNSPWRQ